MLEYRPDSEEVARSRWTSMTESDLARRGRSRSHVHATKLCVIQRVRHLHTHSASYVGYRIEEAQAATKRHGQEPPPYENFKKNKTHFTAPTFDKALFIFFFLLGQNLTCLAEFTLPGRSSFPPSSNRELNLVHTCSTARCSLLTTRTTHRSLLLTAHCSLLTTHYSLCSLLLRTAPCALLTAHSHRSLLLTAHNNSNNPKFFKSWLWSTEPGGVSSHGDLSQFRGMILLRESNIYFAGPRGSTRANIRPARAPLVTKKVLKKGKILWEKIRKKWNLFILITQREVMRVEFATTVLTML